MLWTWCVCFGLLCGEKLTLLASATLDEANFGSCLVLQLTDAQKHLHEVMSTHAQRQSVMGHLMCL